MTNLVMCKLIKTKCDALTDLKQGFSQFMKHNESRHTRLPPKTGDICKFKSAHFLKVPVLCSSNNGCGTYYGF